MKKMISILIAAFLLVSCQTRKMSEQGGASALVFPHGRYNQDVMVDVKAKGHENNFDFSCIIKKNSEEFFFVGYNSFGISLFKIKETKAGVEMESSIKQINERKEFFLKVFALVKSLLSMEKNDPRLAKSAFPISFQGLSSQVSFLDYDEKGIPLKIRIVAESTYEIVIQTTGYEI